MLWNRSTTIKQSLLVDQQEQGGKAAGDVQPRDKNETGRLVGLGESDKLVGRRQY
jgi:hypothetical protein